MNKKSSHGNRNACRVCGCTQMNCSGCIARTGGIRCWWVEADLCSACAISTNERDIAEVSAFVSTLCLGDARIYFAYQQDEYLLDTFFALRRQVDSKSLSLSNAMRYLCAFDLLQEAKGVLGAYGKFIAEGDSPDEQGGSINV